MIFGVDKSINRPLQLILKFLEKNVSLKSISIVAVAGKVKHLEHISEL